MERRFGFIHDKLEIKILILFVLRRLPGPVNIEELAELTLCDDGISYFDFAECVADLVDTEHITDESGMYAVTEKGRMNGEIAETAIAYPVRVRADRSTAAKRAEMTRSAMIRTEHAARDQGGYAVTLSLSDGVGEIIALDLFAANEAQAVQLEKGFRDKAEKIYNQIIRLLLE